MKYNWGVLLLTVRSHIIQEPSMLQLTHSVSFLRTCLPPPPLESSWFVSPWFQRHITGFERPYGVRERETELLQLWLRQRQHGLSLRLSCYGFDSLFATPEPDSKNCSRQDHHEKASFQLQQKPAGFVSVHIQAFKFHEPLSQSADIIYFPHLLLRCYKYWLCISWRNRWILWLGVVSYISFNATTDNTCAVPCRSYGSHSLVSFLSHQSISLIREPHSKLW